MRTSDEQLRTAARSAPESTAISLGLFALAAAGHAANLALIDVVPYSVFQHYVPWSTLAASHPIAAAGAVVHAAVVLIAAVAQRHRLRAVVSGLFRPLSLIVVAGLFAFSLAVPTVSVARFAGEIVMAGSLALVAALNLIVAVLWLPAPIAARAREWAVSRMTLPGTPDTPRPWDRSLPWLIAAWVVIVCALVSVFVLEGIPHIDDSISNLFQARYFADGRLTAPAPPDPDSFQMDQTVVANGKWFGYAFPAWPAALAIGVKLGVPWLVNPALAGALILIAHALVRRRFGLGIANVVILLLAASPWLIFMSAEFMAQPLTAALAMLAALAFDRAADRESRWPWWSILAGAATGALVLTRAIDGALLAIGVGLAVLFERRFVRALPATLVTGVVAAAVAAVMLPYNIAVTGRATYPAHMAWSDGHWGAGVDRLGFGPDVGIRAWPNLDPLPGHGPADVVLNANKNFFMANIELFGWDAGSLLFVWCAVALGKWRRADTLAIALMASWIAGYSTYWFSGGPDLGPRYWYPLIVPMAVLAARGAQMLSAALTSAAKLSEPAARVALLMVAASLSAAVVMVPWRAVTKHYRYRGISADIRGLAQARHIDHALVFVRSAFAREYQSAFIFNPATLDEPDTIYVRDLGADHRALVLARFADRPVWVIGRESGGAALKVIAGPLPPGTNPQ